MTFDFADTMSFIDAFLRLLEDVIDDGCSVREAIEQVEPTLAKMYPRMMQRNNQTVASLDRVARLNGILASLMSDFFDVEYFVYFGTPLDELLSRDTGRLRDIIDRHYANTVCVTSVPLDRALPYAAALRRMCYKHPRQFMDMAHYLRCFDALQVKLAEDAGFSKAFVRCVMTTSAGFVDDAASQALNFYELIFDALKLFIKEYQSFFAGIDNISLCSVLEFSRTYVVHLTDTYRLVKRLTETKGVRWCPSESVFKAPIELRAQLVDACGVTIDRFFKDPLDAVFPLHREFKCERLLEAMQQQQPPPGQLSCVLDATSGDRGVADYSNALVTANALVERAAISRHAFDEFVLAFPHSTFACPAVLKLLALMGSVPPEQQVPYFNTVLGRMKRAASTLPCDSR